MLNVWILVELIILFFAITIWMVLIMIKQRKLEKDLALQRDALVSLVVCLYSKDLTPEQKINFDELIAEITNEVENGSRGNIASPRIQS